MASNNKLHQAKSAKSDEFYTQFADIELEMRHYRQHFLNKTVFCNCDDPMLSNFWRYFHVNFMSLGLKKLIATHYNHDEIPSYKMEYIGGNDLDVATGVVTTLFGDGDFRSDECVDILKGADIVVTNPPFSLFREYVAQLMEYDKKFIILGNVNAIAYKEIFPLIKENRLWLGTSIHSGDRKFGVPDTYPLEAAGCGIDENGQRFIRVKGVRWFTNLDIAKHHAIFFDSESVHAHYIGHEDAYPKYDNYDAINVNKTKDIPVDYFGCMGVPITFLDKYNPDEFEIIRFRKGTDDKDLCINGKCPYFRILIRRKN